MVSASAAIAQNGVIGTDNKLPWHLPEDLKRFKKLTYGKTIFMGRKTFESLGKPLPGRKHIVFTRNADYTTDYPDVEISYQIDETLEKYSKLQEESFVIGGGELYRQALPYCQRLYITEIKRSFAGDAYFYIPSQFELADAGQEIYDEKNDFYYVYKIYERKRACH